MITEILNTYKASLTSLNYIDRFGGLVVPFERIIENKKYVLPISIDPEEKHCWENGGYTELAINEGFKSVSYFEQLGQTKEVKIIGRRQSYYSHTVPVQFCCWLNFKKLGEVKISEVVPHLINTLRGRENSIGNTYRILLKDFSVLNFEECKKQFLKYSYQGDTEKLFFHPYAAFVVRATLEFATREKCVTVSLGDPLTC